MARLVPLPCTLGSSPSSTVLKNGVTVFIALEKVQRIMAWSGATVMMREAFGSVVAQMRRPDSTL